MSKPRKRTTELALGRRGMVACIPRDRRLAALQGFGVDVDQALAEAVARQTASLSVACERISDLVHRCMALREPGAIAALQAEIIACLRTASSGSVVGGLSLMPSVG